MDKDQIKTSVFQQADEMLLAAAYPQAEAISHRLNLPQEVVSRNLSEWWSQLPQRIVLTDGAISALPGIPDTLTQAFGRIWQQAVQEAEGRVAFTRQRSSIGLEEERKGSEEAAHKAQTQYLEMEGRYRELQRRYEEHQELGKTLDAEIAVLKGNLATETNARKKEEQTRIQLEHELAQLRKAYDDARRTFDQRIKDEQRHMLESLAKEEVDTRYYRNALEKAREESGRKEGELTREIHDLQAVIARKDVKIETLKSQVKSQEAELLRFKQDTAVLQKDLARLNAQLLAEANKSKRLEASVKEMQEELRRQNQKQITYSNECSKRENMLRTQVLEKEDALVRAEARLAAMEKRLISADEEIRRLSARI